MAVGQIRFATDIIRRLGEELNPTVDQSVLELVKNSYDANARSCHVELIDTHDVGGSVRVTDDGDGMDLAGIRNGWLVLGSSDKSVRKLTRMGRIPAGNKGLGRLAALRMGDHVTLITRPRSDSANEFTLEIDWSEYDEAKIVEDVQLTIGRRKRRSGETKGTEILIQNLDRPVRRVAARNLARSLLLLADPFRQNPQGFEPTLAAPDFEDLETLLQQRYFQDAEFHLQAKVDVKGNAIARVNDWRGQRLYSATHRELSAGRDGGRYECGAANFDLWVFILNKETFSTRKSTVKEVKNWLSYFGGVHLYHNGLRVSPYGNPGNDWLDMNLRRVQSPEERPSTNTSLGLLSVTDRRELFNQKTDRSGFIESHSFLELRDFVVDGLEFMARRRLEAAEKRRQKARQEVPKKARASKEKLHTVVAKVKGSTREKVESALAAYERSRDLEVKQLQAEVQLYRTLSTAGITAATFAHESTGNPIKVINQSIRAIERRGKAELKSKYSSTLEKPVNSVIRATESLAVLGNATLELLRHEKRRTGRVALHGVIENTLKTFTPFITGRGVELQLELGGGKPYLRGSEAAVESILTNLINNSLTAFEMGATPRRKILIKTAIDDGTFRLSVLDNGPGIEDLDLREVWLPGQSTVPNGTGLGLTIVSDAAKDLGGGCSAEAHGDLGGATFHIDLPLLGS